MMSSSRCRLKRCRKLNPVLGTALLLVTLQAQAEEDAQLDLTPLSLEELLSVNIITANRLPHKNNESPASVEVLTSEDFRAFGWRTLADALNAVRGLYTNNNRNYTFLGNRGFIRNRDYNTRVLLMIDGQRMNENMFDSGFVAQEFMLDTDLIERIEYVSGSGSSIYGGNAFLGMINVVTKSGNALNGAQVANEIGTFDTFKNRATYGKRFENGADVLVSASHFDSSGQQRLYFKEFDSPATNNGIAENLDAERADRLFGKFKYEEFTFSGGYVNRFKRVPTAEYGAVFNDPNLTTKDKQIFANVRYDKNFGEQWALMMRGFYQSYQYFGRAPYASNQTVVINNDLAMGRWWGGEAQLTTTFWNHHRLMLGAELQVDEQQKMYNYDVEPYTLYSSSNRSGSRIELYLQDDYQFAEDWILSAGMRWDYHHMIANDQFNPRVGLIWNPLESTSFKLLYSSSFRAPNVFEQDSSGGRPFLLAEEHVKSLEGVVEWTPYKNLRLVGTAFYNEMRHVIESGTQKFANTGRYSTHGTELQAEWRGEKGRLLKASYTYNLLTDEQVNGAWGIASPQNLLKLHYVEPIYNGFALLGLESLFVDRRHSIESNDLPAFNVVNLNLSSKQILPGADISFSVYNLFDSHYPLHSHYPVNGEATGSIASESFPSNGRELRLKLVLNF